MICKTTLLLCAALLAGHAPADDGTKGKGAGYGAQAKLGEAELERLLEEALDSCCAAGTCADEGGCATRSCAACESGPGASEPGECDPAAHRPSPAEQVVSACARDPEALAAVAPRLEERFVDAREGQRELMLEILAWSPGHVSTATGEKLYRAVPAAFREDHLLVFAPRSATFARALEELARKGAVRPAAYFARKGDEKARATLVEAARSRGLGLESMADQLVAARVLAELGEPRYLPSVHERVLAAVVDALDGGDLATARRMALQAEFLAKEHDLGTLGRRMETYVAQRSKEVASADEIFALIERITPIM